MKRYMKKPLLLAAMWSCIHWPQWAQESAKNSRDKSQFSIGLINGVNTTKASTMSGVDHIRDSWDLLHALRFAYRYQLSPKFYAEAGFGFGGQSIAYGYEQNGAKPGVFDRHSLRYFSFARFDVLAAYNLFSFSNKRVNLIGGFGANRFSHIAYGTGVSYGGLGHQSSFDIQTKDRFLGLLQLGLEFAHTNKKQNEFGFRIFYQHGFNSFHDGQFTHNDNQVFSTGILSSPLRGLNFSVNYTFTRAKRMQRMFELSESMGMNRKQAKNEFKKEKRYIEPKSRYLTLCTGLAFSGTHFNRTEKVLSTQKFATIALNVSYEHGWKNNLFFEGKYNRLSISSGELMKTELGNYSTAGNAFVGHFLSAGMGYRIQNPKTNFQFFNVHAGLGVGFTLQNKGINQYGSGSLSYDEQNFSFNYVNEQTAKVMPILYFGISKDIRLTDRLALNFAYTRQHGLRSVYNSTFNYWSTTSPEIKTTQGRIRGSANLFQFGLKYRIK